MPRRISSAMRYVTTRVLPVPAPANTKQRPAERADGFALSRIEAVSHG